MKYIKLFENIDFEKISKDIDSLDIEEHIKIIKKLKNFTNKKAKELNKIIKIKKESEILNRIKYILDYIKEILNDKFLKNIENVYFNKIDDIIIKKFYKKEILSKSLNSIETKLNNNNLIIDSINIIIFIDSLSFTLYIYQYINKNKELFYKVNTYTHQHHLHNDYNFFLKKYGNFYKIFNRKELDEYLKELKKDLVDLSIEFNYKKYNI